MNKTKYLILFTVFIDIIGLGIIIPVLPYYVSTFNASPVIMTALFAVFSICAFFSAPLISSWSDKIGRRPMLIGSITSTAIGWLVFAGAPNIIWLFMGRIIDGLAAGNFPVAQSYLVDISTDEEDRTNNLGLIGAMFGIGLIVGPIIGGLLAHFNYSWPFWFVGIMALLNAVLAYFFLPETRKKSTQDITISFNPLQPIVKAFRDLGTRQTYLLWLLFCSAIAIYQSIFALYLQRAFGWEELMVGLIFSGVGLVIALNQIFAMKKIWLKRFPLFRLNQLMTITFAMGFLLLVFKTWWIFFIGVFLTTISQGILRATIASSATASGEDHGEKLGIMSSIMMLTMSVLPVLAGIIFAIDLSLPFILASALMFVAYVVTQKK
jgi:MFS family permease